MLQEINKDLLLYLNSLLEYDFIQTFAMIFADTPIFLLPLFLSWAWIYYSYSKKTIIVSKITPTKNLLEKENLLYIFYACVLWIVMSLIIQQIVVIDRPETAIAGTGMLLLDHIPDASFPSDHATVAIAFLSWLFLAGYKKLWYIYLPLALAMIFSRVILWVHWPFDVIIWSLVWIFAAFVVFQYAPKCSLIQSINKWVIQMMKYIKL